jgi:hypothetical protein
MFSKNAKKALFGVIFKKESKSKKLKLSLKIETPKGL